MQSSPQKDGYYYRLSKDTPAIGPFSQARFLSLRETGSIQVHAKSWRIARGHIFEVKSTQQLAWSKVCSCAAWRHLCEYLQVVAASLLIVFAFTLIDWEKEIEQEPNAVYLLGCLSVVAVVMSAYTLRTVYKRWKRNASTIRHSEV